MVKYLISKLLKKIQIPAIKNSKIEVSSKVCSGSHVVNTSIGRFSYIGNNCTVIETDIGMFCSIADNVIIGGAAHPTSWGSTSPVFHAGKNILNKNFSSHDFKSVIKTVVQNDVWIGNNVLLKSGIVVKTGAVIGMGAVVTKNVGAYEVWGGNPAKLIKKRFDDETISKLLNSQWWELDEKSLTTKAMSIHKVDVFTNMEKG